MKFGFHMGENRGHQAEYGANFSPKYSKQHIDIWHSQYDFGSQLS
jgi:hypothetical protein